MTSKAQALLLGTLLLGIGGCKTGSSAAPPPVGSASGTPVLAPTASASAAEREPAFTNLATASPALVASLVVVSPSKLFADLDALSGHLGLSFLAARELVPALGAMAYPGGARPFQAVMDRLDPMANLAVVWLLSGKSSAHGFCAAMTFRTRSEAQRTWDEMGAPGAERNGTSERRTSSGDAIWGGIKGRTLFISGSPDALLFAGAVAEAAQSAAPAGQIVFTGLPQSLARESGQAPDALIAKVVSEMTSLAASEQGKDNLAHQRAIAAAADVVGRMLLGSTAARLLVNISPRDGLVLRGEIDPSPGSAFAARTAHRLPFAFDRRLPVRGDGTSMVALGDLGSFAANWGKVYEATGPAGKSLWRDANKLFEMTTGASCVAELAGDPFSAVCSLALRPGTSARAAMSAWTAVISAQGSWEAELDGRRVSTLKIRHVADIVEIEKKLEGADSMTKAALKAMVGGDSILSAVMVKDGNLVHATGRHAKELLARYGTASAAQGGPLLAATLARNEGAEAVASVDVLSLLLRLLGTVPGLASGETAMIAMLANGLPGLASMKAPFVFAVRGGSTLTGEFQIPLGSLEALAKVLRNVMGGMGGLPSQ